MPSSTTGQRPRLRFQLQDILSVVVGYGTAALLFRAFWSASWLSPTLGLAALALYFWLGLAMSGPVIFALQGPMPRPAREPDHHPSSAAGRTWAEQAWLLIGIYWMILGVLVIPSRLRDFKPGDMILFGLVPLGLILGFRLFGHGGTGREGRSAWTHAVAVLLLVTWPVAWACLTIVGTGLR